jgi:O-antigen ligase
VASAFRRNGYSPRARLLALFIVLALILGGGGTPNPTTEITLELLFVGFALGWLRLSHSEAGPESAPGDRLVLLLVAIPLVIPVVQLIPLPPAIWTALPGRENELAALSLVGAQDSWRPISLSPSRTLASLLAIIPAAFCCYAASRLTLHERRLVLLAILAMAVVTSIFGAIQLSAGDPGISLYPEHHVGWITGFQANRNAAADVLLIGLLALAVLGAPYLAGSRRKLPMSLDRRSLSMLVAGLGLLLLAAIVMTGSRTGILLILVAGAAVVAILSLGRKASRFTAIPGAIVVLAIALALGVVVVFGALTEQSALVRVAERFSDFGQSRANLWEDAWFALRQYWPVGFGMGGFEPAMLPAERLEFLDASLPNRAHNDFLELGLEAGLLGYVMVAAAVTTCIAMACRAWRDGTEMRGHVVFAMAVLLSVALHSVVDYPLRSMAVACLAGVAGGFLARRTSPARHAASFEAGELVKGQA